MFSTSFGKLFSVATNWFADTMLLVEAPSLIKVHRYHIFSAGWSILLTLTAVWTIIFSSNWSLYGVDPFSIIIIFLYIIGAWLLFRLEHKKTSEPEIKDLQSEEEALEKIYGDISPGRAVQGFVAMATTIIVSGLFLTRSEKSIATYTGLSGSFFGAIFVAPSTLLPELATSIGATTKAKAYDTILGDLFCNNMFTIATIFFADLAFRQGSILKVADENQMLVASVAITLTIIAILSLNYRSKRELFKVGIGSLAILAVYFLGIFTLFQQGINF